MFALSMRHALLAVLLAGTALTPSAAVTQELETVQVIASSIPAPALGGATSSAPVDAAPNRVAAESRLGASALTAKSVLLPTWSATASPFEVSPTSAPAFVPFQEGVRAGPNIALMAVGGAGLVIGLAMGGDTGNIIATTGAVIALVGLYRYLK